MRRFLGFLKNAFKKHFFTGLLVVLPTWLTIILLYFLIDYMDQFFKILPRRFQPDTLLGFHVPEIGLILAVIIIVGTGIIARNYFGQKLIKLGDRIISQIPIGRGIYNTFKQIMETIMVKGSVSFRKVVLIEYPRKGLYCLAFVTGPVDERLEEAAKQKLLNLFIPTTPNPTSGFYIMMPEAEAVEVPISVEEAFKLVISAGIVQKKNNKDRLPAPAPEEI